MKERDTLRMASTLGRLCLNLIIMATVEEREYFLIDSVQGLSSQFLQFNLLHRHTVDRFCFTVLIVFCLILHCRHKSFDCWVSRDGEIVELLMLRLYFLLLRRDAKSLLFVCEDSSAVTEGWPLSAFQRHRYSSRWASQRYRKNRWKWMNEWMNEWRERNRALLLVVFPFRYVIELAIANRCVCFWFCFNRWLLLRGSWARSSVSKWIRR